jgi:CheY-like chemotaxis protein
MSELFLTLMIANKRFREISKEDKVEIALNGRNGIQKFDGGSFDLVITDILMPEVDGREVVKHIRNSDRPYTPIIGCSGTPWLLEDGEFDTVFLKPFPLADLVHAVRHLSRL